MVPFAGWTKRECESENFAQVCLAMKLSGFLGGFVIARKSLTEPLRSIAEKVESVSRKPELWNQLVQELSASCDWLHHEAVFESPILRDTIVLELSKQLEKGEFRLERHLSEDEILELVQSNSPGRVYNQGFHQTQES
jgi:hypothetical protein